jgi:hypothetical protein
MKSLTDSAVSGRSWLSISICLVLTGFFANAQNPVTTPIRSSSDNVTSPVAPLTPLKVCFVGDGGTWSNWDIYSCYLPNGTPVRLTTDPAIDNHPDISHADTNRIVFSSNRVNDEFDLYLANDIHNIEGTKVRLTNDLYPGVPPGGPPDPDPYPDRHPHWHPGGQIIIFTAKNRAELTGQVIISTCSHPGFGKFFAKWLGGLRFWVQYKLYEGINVIKIDAAGNVLNYIKLDIRMAWDAANPDTTISRIWIPGDSAYCGHPSFNSTGDKIIFTASIDGEGKIWEIYTAGFDPVSLSLIPNSLRRITYGPNQTTNPIKMSGGAKFSNNDSLIYFNSTRITAGNSQIYSLPSTSLNCPVTSATQLTFHEGNDYVPQPLPEQQQDHDHLRPWTGQALFQL